MILIADFILHPGFTAQPQSCGENRRQQPLPPENHDDIGVQKPKLWTPTKKNKNRNTLERIHVGCNSLGIGRVLRRTVSFTYLPCYLEQC